MTFKHHDLKIWPEFYADLIAGRKPFELRKNDRDFEVGDELDLHEYNPKTQEFTGCVTVRTISYILGHRPDAGCAATFGIQPGYVILGLSPCAVQSNHPLAELPEYLDCLEADLISKDLDMRLKDMVQPGIWADRVRAALAIPTPAQAVQEPVLTGLQEDMILMSFHNEPVPQPAKAVTERDKAEYKIGWWLSAALEDPAVCAEMKADINAWFEACQPGLVMTSAQRNGPRHRGAISPEPPENAQ